jgi:hypothetical protein
VENVDAARKAGTAAAAAPAGGRCQAGDVREVLGAGARLYRPNFPPCANCSNDRRYGYLTCRMHPAREDAARELLEKLRAVTKRLRNCL